MLADYNYMSANPCSSCPYASYGQYQEPAYMESQAVENPEPVAREEEENGMYRRPPFFPGPFFGPRPFFGPGPFFGPPFFGPRPFPFFGPRPFFGPGPFFGGFGLPFLSGLALGGLLF